MVFDDYKIEKMPLKNKPKNKFSIKMIDGLPTMSFEAGKYLIQSSNDLISWNDLSTIEGESQFIDKNYSTKKSQRYYRLRLIE